MAEGQGGCGIPVDYMGIYLYILSMISQHDEISPLPRDHRAMMEAVPELKVLVGEMVHEHGSSGMCPGDF